MSEASRANAANQCFDVADKLIKQARQFLERAADTKLSLAERKSAGDLAARFFQVSKDVIMAFGEIPGPAQGYQGSQVAFQIVNQHVNELGQLVEAPAPVTSLEEAERIIAEGEQGPAALPCSDWSPDDKDATPVPPYQPPKPEPPPKPERTVPSRMTERPTSDGTDPITGRGPVSTGMYRCAVVPIEAVKYT